MKSIRLNNGVDIPQLGFGTAALGEWQQDDEQVVDIVLRAIEAGYRHIDTASLYGNERSVGKAINQSGLPREAFFLTSKVWDNEQGYDDTLAAFERSIERLQTDYLDLYLVHWPVPHQTEATWRAMETLYEQKRTRALGLSNFRQQDIEQILAKAKHKPTYNQLELHPYLIQKPLVEYCESHGMVVSCWSPLGSGNWSSATVEEKPISDPVIINIAAQHGVSPGQVILKWDVQQGRIVIPKAQSQKNLLGNLQLDSFTLSAEDISAIDALEKGKRFGGDPDVAWKTNMDMVVPA